MKLTTGILAVVMITGAAWGQNPATIDNPRSDTKSLPQTKTNKLQPVLVAQAKPAPGAPAPAVKPATIPGAAAAPAPAKAAAVPAPVQSNTLQRVNVVRNADDIKIEISSREAVTPKVSKLSSPARVVVELPATSMATAQSKIPVGSAGVKGVRIGMDGKTPPNTSVVVDLEQALTYELTPGPGNSFVLTLHTQQAAAQASAKSTPAPAPKAQTVAAAKPVAAPAAAAPAAKSKTAPAVAAVKPAVQPHDAFVPKKAAASAPVVVAKVEAPKAAATHAAPATAKATADEKAAAASVIGEAPKPPQPEEKKWAMNGKRDPFFSPVVQQPTGSGCSTGKKCLEIGQINLRGVVKSESGFIAVVTNTLNKAYFLHENDPVFNGYVMRITGDSVVFEETVQDKLGKPFTREVVKKISTPAV
jgi:Tfp pilus assembly protein PilP